MKRLKRFALAKHEEKCKPIHTFVWIRIFTHKITIQYSEFFEFMFKIKAKMQK